MNDFVFMLLCYLFLREIAFFYQLNKLLNKLMSRNYNEYEYSKNIAKTMSNGEMKLKEDTELPEDLSPIQGFGGMN